MNLGEILLHAKWNRRAWQLLFKKAEYAKAPWVNVAPVEKRHFFVEHQQNRFEKFKHSHGRKTASVNYQGVIVDLTHIPIEGRIIFDRQKGGRLPAQFHQRPQLRMERRKGRRPSMNQDSALIFDDAPLDVNRVTEPLKTNSLPHLRSREARLAKVLRKNNRDAACLAIERLCVAGRLQRKCAPVEAAGTVLRGGS